MKSSTANVMQLAASDDVIGERFRWIDIAWTDPTELTTILAEYGFDVAAVEDALDIEQLPKVDEYDDHLFVVLHALTHAGSRVDTVEVDCFVADGILVTAHRSEVMAIDWLWANVQKYAHLSDEGIYELFGHLVEAIGRRYLEVIGEFERRIDVLADPALAGDASVLGEIQSLRREESTIRSMLRPQRLVVSGLRRVQRLQDGEDARRQFADAYDIHNQIVETLVSVRQLLTDTLDTYRGAAAEVQSRASTLLTVYAAIVLPMTLIAGWYGMNTANLPAASRSWGWIVVTAVMLAVGFVSWLAFVRIGLVGRPRGVRQVGKGIASAALRPMKHSVMLRQGD